MYISSVEVGSCKNSVPKAGWTWVKIEEGVFEEYVGTPGREAALAVAHQLSMNCSLLDISTGYILSVCPY